MDNPNNDEYPAFLPRVKSELELLREQNIRERDAFLASLMSDPEFAELMIPVDKPKKIVHRTKRGNENDDPAFRFSGTIPLQQRKSARLQNKSPIFTKDDLPSESTIARAGGWFDTSYESIDEVVYKPKKFRVSTNRPQNVNIIPVETVTEFMLNQIARKGTNKKYSENGSTCHQCRQKTIDQKTCCRNKNCFGVRGQFCGVCLENRYGEDAAVALKDPDWHCPVCREICNCSFCRARAGKRPTGILAPIAQQAGHKSVKDFLDSLMGQGDYSYQDKLWQDMDNPNNLLGFSKDLTIAHMGKNVQHKMHIPLAPEEFHIHIREAKKKLAFLIENHKKNNLLGFLDANTAVMSDGSHINLMRHDLCIGKFECLEHQNKENN